MTSPRPIAAMTLLEIAISLLVLAIAVTGSLLLFPAGIKAQQAAAFQLYAAAKAIEMVESFTATHNANPTIDSESPEPWDVPTTYRSLAWDLEQRLSTHRFGIMPLPLDIARRLDSQDDEIQRVLADGGYVYYSQPMATTNLEEESLAAAPASETQKLVFAINGPAQTNALFGLPAKSWPYYAPYPSPPSHMQHRPDPSIAGTIRTNLRDQWRTEYGWEAVHHPRADLGTDPAIEPLFEAYLAYGHAATPTEALAIAYLQAALWYGDQKGLDAAAYDPSSAPTPIAFFDDGRIAGVPARDAVQCFRFLAHAGACLMRWRSADDLGGEAWTSGGLAIPSAPVGGGASPAVALCHADLAYWHESCLRLAMRFAASEPYDWGAPRVAQRAQMMDFVLLEPDLFAPPRVGALAGEPSVVARQWQIIPSRPIRNIGLSSTFPDRPTPIDDRADPSTANGYWGAAERFSLTAPFAPSERCRQIVFWSVDWQAYEDCETAPSAPVDASKYPIAAELHDATFAARMQSGNVRFRDEQLYAFRNPEKTIMFRWPVAGLPTGFDLAQDPLVEDDDYRVLNNFDGDQPDQGSDPGQRAVFAGLHGADRDFDGLLDRGPAPRSTRMRATTVARFNFYDPRVQAVLR